MGGTMDNSVKIHKVSLTLQYICYLFLALAGFLIVMTIYNVNFNPEVLNEYISDEAMRFIGYIEQAPAIRAIPASILLFFPLPLVMYAYWRLSLLLGLFKRGTYFTEANAQHLFMFALLWFLFQILPMPMIFIADLLLTVGTGIQDRGISVMINGDEIPHFLASGSFLVIAWILREAVKIARENAEFV
jgi:hypothetical protein